MIAARLKDGSRVRRGDWVLIVQRGGKKFSGRVAEITGTRRFRGMDNALLQTYIVRTANGNEVPAHARAIKAAKRGLWTPTRRRKS